MVYLFGACFFFLHMLAIDGFVPPTSLGRGRAQFVSIDNVDVFDAYGPTDVCFAFDYDGTLVKIGEKLEPKDEQVFRDLKKIGIRIFIITAQSAEYMKQSVDPSIFSGIICECNVDMIYPNGKVMEMMDLESMLPAQERIEEFIDKMNLNFDVNRKRAGFAVDVREATEEQQKVVEAEVKAMAFEDGMRCASTAGFIDYMLPSRVQNKALGLKALKKRFPNYKFITGGDSINTDGPMLELSDSAYIVGGDTFKTAKKITSPAVSMRLLTFLEYLCRSIIE
jgi:hydroxymethylpyrimidine pyrophosphatase-like HAD family hydrolase